MSTSDEEITNLFRVRRTLMQMLNDRDYLVSDDDLNMTKKQLIEKYGQTIQREDISIHASKRDDNDNQILVFFAKDPKPGVNVVKGIIHRMKSENVFRAILVIQGAVSFQAKHCIAEASSRFKLEVFTDSELLVNVKNHAVVPEHQVLTDEEKKALLEKYTVKETQLPRILITDPIARYYGMNRGQVVKIIRPSETAGKYVTYRFVV